MNEMGHSELCQQPDFGLSCGGCCGFFYEPRISMIHGFIRGNTERFRKYLREHDGQMSRYFREFPRHTDHSLCEYLVFLDADESRIGCAGHPAINRMDYREKFVECNPGNCPNSWSFDRLDDSMKREVLERLKKRYGGNPIRLSLDMYTDKIQIRPPGRFKPAPASP